MEEEQSPRGKRRVAKALADLCDQASLGSGEVHVVIRPKCGEEHAHPQPNLEWGEPVRGSRIVNQHPHDDHPQGDVHEALPDDEDHSPTLERGGTDHLHEEEDQNSYENEYDLCAVHQTPPFSVEWTRKYSINKRFCQVDVQSRKILN